MMIAALLLPVSAQAQCGNAEFAQCGGQGYAGDTCCPEYDECKFVNTFFSQCQPRGLCLVPQYGQCGGSDNHQPPRPWTPENHHQQCCPPSFFCSYQNPHFSQCVYNTTANTTCASAYDQCGGHGWAGKTCCIPGYECVAQTEYYSGCNPAPLCTNTRFGQCGGVDADNNPWTREFGHSDCCPDGFECAYKSTYFSQCMQSSSRAAAAVAIEAEPLYGDHSPRAFSIQAQMRSIRVPAAPFECKIGAGCASAQEFEEEPSAMCSTSDDCDAGKTCVVESPYYASCVDCTEAVFATQCSYMSETFLPKAEKACGIEHCAGRCPQHTDAECDGSKVCVVQADNNYAQCISCNTTTFDSECKFWSATIRTAAEAKCGVTCPK